MEASNLSTKRIEPNRLFFGLIGLVLVVGASAGIAVSSASASTAQSTQFLCADGERLLVAPQAGSVRIRTSAGVFNLSAGDERNQFQGQFLQVNLGADALELTRPGQSAPVSCKALRQRT